MNKATENKEDFKMKSAMYNSIKIPFENRCGVESLIEGFGLPYIVGDIGLSELVVIDLSHEVDEGGTRVWKCEASNDLSFALSLKEEGSVVIKGYNNESYVIPVERGWCR